LTIDFENNYHLAFINTRLLGKIYWLKEPRDFIQKKDLGPDADRMQKKTFLKKLDEKNGMIKSALMDQSFMAGIGNEYSDEILYQTKIYPRKKISGLSGEERERIFDTMQKVLEKAVEVGADHSKLPHSYLLSHRKKGGKCPEHDVKLKRIRAGGRRGYYCPVCQKKSD
jgi:formamidopyrimidine-DNA glycosylase